MDETRGHATDLGGWISPTLIGIAGCIALNPYFLWPTHVGQLVVAAVLSSLALVWTISRKEYQFPTGVEACGVVLLTLFVVYITLEHRLDGGHSKWIVVLPTLWALALLPDPLRTRCLRVFITVFALSLIPGMVVWSLVALGVPIEFSTMAPANPNVLPTGGSDLLYLPGAVFIESNSIVLKTGSVLFRMCGIYDEPGTVGTIAALMLAAVRFRINNWRYLIVYLAGIMSFSLAFVVLAIVGFFITLVTSRSWRILIYLVPLILSLALTLNWINVSAQRGTKSNVGVQIAVPSSQTSGAPPQSADTSSRSTGTPAPTTDTSAQTSVASPQADKPIVHRSAVENGSGEVLVTSGYQLRQTESINNRALPEMKALMNEYWHSDFSTRLFGIASDASVEKGGMSQVVWRIFTDFGLVGFALLVIGCVCLGIPIWLRNGTTWWSILFVAVFAMSFYQRPVIWLPYGLIFLFCGIQLSSKGRESKSFA